jgi:hypothetical protein
MGTDITLTSSYGTAPPSTQPMPQATACSVCRKHYSEHVEEKCLFDSTMFQQEDFYAYRQRFEAWMAGQRLEDCLALIVYNLTRVKP